MTLAIRFSAGARGDLLETLQWYAARDPRLAPKVREAVQAAPDLAGSQPLGGQPGPFATRRIVVRGFPLILIYRLQAESLCVIAIAPHRRKPAYWSDR